MQTKYTGTGETIVITRTNSMGLKRSVEWVFKKGPIEWILKKEPVELSTKRTTSTEEENQLGLVCHRMQTKYTGTGGNIVITRTSRMGSQKKTMISVGSQKPVE